MAAPNREPSMTNKKTNSKWPTAWLLLLLFSLMLAACSSLPTIVPDMDSRSRRATSR
jgi:cardiolipin synthase